MNNSDYITLYHSSQFALYAKFIEFMNKMSENGNYYIIVLDFFLKNIFIIVGRVFVWYMCD